MSDRDQSDQADEPSEFAAVNRLEQDLRRVIDYYCQEYDLSYAALAGTLQMIQASILDQWMHGDEDDEDDDENPFGTSES
jgi:hypothetical protein